MKAVNLEHQLLYRRPLWYTGSEKFITITLLVKWHYYIVLV